MVMVIFVGLGLLVVVAICCYKLDQWEVKEAREAKEEEEVQWERIVKAREARGTQIKKEKGAVRSNCERKRAEIAKCESQQVLIDGINYYRKNEVSSKNMTEEGHNYLRFAASRGRDNTKKEKHMAQSMGDNGQSIEELREIATQAVNDYQNAKTTDIEMFYNTCF